MPLNFVIGILSARENALHRSTLRSLLTHQIATLEIEANLSYHFIVGNSPCPIAPSDRVSRYSCVKWNYDSQRITSGEMFSSFLSKISTEIKTCNSTFARHYSFEVAKFALRITKLGVFVGALNPDEPVFVLLMDKTNNEIYAKSKFLLNEDMQFNNGYAYLPTEEFIFPPGFKGVLSIKGDIKDSLMGCHPSISWNTGGLIKFHSLDYSNEVAVLAFAFEVHNFSELKEHVDNTGARLESWREKNIREALNIEREQSKYGDLALVDVIDVYRNLPSKLLTFYSWLVAKYTFNYFMKTDDDCAINLQKIMEKLTLHESLSSHKLWWGTFRREWPVNRYGKWTDEEYPSNFYPIFACGSGNVLSSHLVSWLANNSKFLHPFQGEDVSLGIWLGGLLPNYIDDDNWSCDETCNAGSYVRAQLSIEEMETTRKLMNECGSICSCNAG